PKAFYGQDVPGIVRDNFIIGGILAVQALFLRWWSKKRESTLLPLFALLSGVIAIVAGLSVLESLAILWDSRIVKLWERDRLFDQLKLRGNESVLDVGCGHGLLLVGAAKRLPYGRAVGIDLWSQIDQGSNNKEATLTNAHIEGVEDRVEVHNGDMRDMPFPDASFDVVVGIQAIHNIESPEGRYRAAQEIRRVLKPGGRIAILDIYHVKQVAECFRQCGMQDVRVSLPRLWYYPPMQTITGKK
ncbi:MAG: methyltransferase domain-containing protein, partial [Ktedonobacteraceae bacterium]|nr:methyltransferase domain-containing protein [Ktedonobacteraceae bacterium]